MRRIPVYEPMLKGNEKKYLQQAIDNGWVSGNGPFVKRFEEAFAKYMGVRYAVAVCNGTAALETMLWAYKDRYTCMEVTNSTIISCAIALKRLYKAPIFVDIELDDGCARHSNWDSLVVHSFGNYCKPPKAFYFYLEDRSQYWAKRPVKHAACYSLYSNKLITAGEGGVIITNSVEASSRMQRYRDLCHTKERFVHSDLAYNFRMSNVCGAIALAQLEQIETFVEQRRRVHRLFKERLKAEYRVVNGNADVPWMTLVEVPEGAERGVRWLGDNRIEARRFFSPSHRQKPLLTVQVLPNSDYAWKHWLYLPSSPKLTAKEVSRICRCLGNMPSTMT